MNFRFNRFAADLLLFAPSLAVVAIDADRVGYFVLPFFAVALTLAVLPMHRPLVRSRLLLLAFIFLLCGFSLIRIAALRPFCPVPLFQVNRLSLEVQGEAVRSGGGWRMEALLKQVEFSSGGGTVSRAGASGRVCLLADLPPGEAVPLGGELILFEPDWSRLRALSAPGDDSAGWLPGAGRLLRGRILEVRNPPAAGWSGVVRSLRSRLRGWGEAGGEVAGLALALLDGDRSRASEGVKRGYREAGAAHLLALSGMHLGVISALVVLVIRPFAGRLAALAIALVFGGCFTLFAGSSPSLVRAALMTGLLFLFRIKGGKSPLLLIIALSLAISLLLQPHRRDSPSLILSYLALTGLVILQPGFAFLFRQVVPRKSAGAVAAVYSAQAASCSYVIPVFGSLSAGGMGASLLLTPLTFLIMGGGAFSAACWLSGAQGLSMRVIDLMKPLYLLNRNILLYFARWPKISSPFELFLYFSPLMLLSLYFLVVNFIHAGYRKEAGLRSRTGILQLFLSHTRADGTTRSDDAKTLRSELSTEPERPPADR